MTLKISPPTGPVRFQGGAWTSRTQHPLIPEGRLRHETAFFRHPLGLEYVAQDPDLKVRSHLNIADFGCSTGEEAYSLAMILAHRNPGQTTQIRGYDLSNKALKQAKKGQFVVAHMMGDPNLLNRVDAFQDAFLMFHAPSNQASPEDTKRRQDYQSWFHGWFQPVQSWLPVLPRMSAQCWLLPLYCMKAQKVQVRPQKQAVCSFHTGDFTQSQAVLVPHSTDAVLFRNALYHLTGIPKEHGGQGIQSERSMRALLEKTFRQLNHGLKPQGLFVLGRKDIPGTPYGWMIAQELSRHGFAPVFTEDDAPTVWKKVQEAKPQD